MGTAVKGKLNWLFYNYVKYDILVNSFDVYKIL